MAGLGESLSSCGITSFRTALSLLSDAFATNLEATAADPSGFGSCHDCLSYWLLLVIVVLLLL